MILSYYDTPRKPKRLLARMWMAANAILALGILFYWSGLVGLVGEPYRWAIQSSVTAQPRLFDPNYMLLWATPLLCMIAGWLAMRARQYQIARIVGCYPTMFLAIMVGWYYLAPVNWL